jgi:hypothetical protein
MIVESLSTSFFVLPLALAALAALRQSAVLGHCALLVCWVVPTSQCQRLFYAVVFFWGLVESVRGRPWGSRPALFLLGCGLLLFGLRLLALTDQTQISIWAMTREAVTSLIKTTIWSMLVVRTLRTRREVLLVIMAWSVLRVLEPGAVGLWGYMNPELFRDIQLTLPSTDADSLDDLTRVAKLERLGGLLLANPVESSFQLALVCAFLMAVLAYRGSLALFALLVVAAVALVLTWSRTGLLMIVSSSVVLIALIRGGRRAKLLLVVALTGVALTLSLPTFTSRLVQYRDLGDTENILTRIEVQRSYFQAAFQQGLIGLAVPTKRIPEHIQGGVGISSENALLQAYIETGWIGGSAYLCLFLYGGSLTVRLWRGLRQGRYGEVDRRAVAAWLAGAPVALLATLTFLVHYSEPTTWLLVSLGAALVSCDDAEGRSRVVPSLSTSFAAGSSVRAALREGASSGL